ncbi:MAG TPA: heme exporter protein CcmD [Rhodobacteraceae bacterium]|jgi:heme exporter protein D|nr:heme exporter protein CcmD [Paracoccaceae bacterium]
MMPDLGKYHSEVLASYAVTFGLLLILLVLSLLRSRRVVRNLAEVGARQKKKHD